MTKFVLELVMTTPSPERIVGRMKKHYHLRPRCRGIDPDCDNTSGGYYCKFCGYSLVETKTGWWRHGTTWVDPSAWLRPRR